MFGMKCMAANTLHFDPYSIDINPVAFAHFNGAKANPFAHLVDDCIIFIQQSEHHIVKVGKLRIPCFGICHFP